MVFKISVLVNFNFELNKKLKLKGELVTCKTQREKEVGLPGKMYQLKRRHRRMNQSLFPTDPDYEIKSEYASQ